MSNYIITSVQFIIYKDKYELNAHYPDIQKYLTDNNIKQEDVTAKQLYQIICEIRTSKMPSRDERGCAGSFRKNPIVSTNDIEKIKSIDPNLKFFPYEDNFKLAAGQLLENLGYK
jgi:UDP-N-acetylmuramate dehydrogenase